MGPSGGGDSRREDTRRLISTFDGNEPDDLRLVSVLGDAERFLLGLPKEFSFAYTRRAEPPAGASGEALAYLLFHDLWCWMGYVLYSTAYRFGWLIEDVWSGLDDREFLRTCSSARSLLELSAALNATYKSIGPALGFLDRWPPQELAKGSFETLIAAQEACKRYVTATRFNWESQRDFKAQLESPDAESPTTNILTLIAKLPQPVPGSALYFHKLLSDCVHPNMGSHFLPTEGMVDLGAETAVVGLAYHPQGTLPVEHVFNVVSLPLLIAVPVLTNQLSQTYECHLVLQRWKEQLSDNHPGLEDTH